MKSTGIENGIVGAAWLTAADGLPPRQLPDAEQQHARAMLLRPMKRIWPSLSAGTFEHLPPRARAEEGQQPFQHQHQRQRAEQQVTHGG
jgi:hypothetical protein